MNIPILDQILSSVSLVMACIGVGVIVSGAFASLTVIRTILSYFINQEIQSLSSTERAQIR